MTTTHSKDDPLESAAHSPDDRLSVGLKLGWATGAFGVALLMNGIAGLILLFTASILKIDPWLAGLVIFLAKLIDVVTDPIVGLWSDRLKSPRGRRRPFLLWGAFMAAASFGMIFAAPSFENQYLAAFYIFAALTFYAIAYTVYNIPYIAMPAEMTDNYHERSSIHAYRMVFVSLGGMVAGAGVKFVLDYLGPTEASSWRLVGIVCAAMILVSMLISYFSTASARFTDPEEDTGKNKFEQLRDEYGAVVGNRHFMRLIGVKFAQLMGVQTMGAGLAYFFVQYMQRDFQYLGWFFLVASISTIIFSPLLVQFSKAYGKKNAYYLAAVANILYAISWSLAGPGEPLWTILLRASVVGIAFGGNVIMAMSMLTDIINEDAGRSGVRREGAFTALYSFVEKLTGAIGPLVVGIALTWVGFDKNLPFDVPQGDNVNMALTLAVSWLPALLYFIGAWLLSGYKLTEEEINATQAKSNRHEGQGL